MKKTFSRRDSLKLMGSAVVGSQVVGAAQPLVAETDRGRPGGIGGVGAVDADTLVAEDGRITAFGKEKDIDAAGDQGFCWCVAARRGFNSVALAIQPSSNGVHDLSSVDRRRAGNGESISGRSPSKHDRTAPFPHGPGGVRYKIWD